MQVKTGNESLEPIAEKAGSGSTPCWRHRSGTNQTIGDRVLHRLKHSNKW